MGKNLGYKVVFVSWMMLVTFFSLFSFTDVDSSKFNIPHLDKVVHFTFYFVMVVLAFKAMSKERRHGVNRHKLLWYIVLFAVMYGIIIEVLQHIATTDRHGDLLDALANSTGAIVGMLVVRFLFFRAPSLK